MPKRVEECVASIQEDNPDMSESTAWAICQSEYDEQKLLGIKRDLNLSEDETISAIKLLLRESASQKAQLTQRERDAGLTQEDFIPPKTAQENAQQALDWNEEHPDEVDAMTDTGWARANQLADGEELSKETVNRMAQFRRHEDNASVDEQHEGEPWKDNGRVAWLGWGGDAGISWAENLSDRLEEIEDEESEDGS